LYRNTQSEKSRKITSLNGLLGRFGLENFDGFFDKYKEKNTLAAEALLALEHFLTTLNTFFDLVDDLHEETIINNTNISWYSYTNLAASGDYIRAVSKYYYEPEFSNISINMSIDEADDYNTDEGNCFGKVFIFAIIYLIHRYLTN
jgi:hypothetical protein